MFLTTILPSLAGKSLSELAGTQTTIKASVHLSNIIQSFVPNDSCSNLKLGRQITKQEHNLEMYVETIYFKEWKEGYTIRLSFPIHEFTEVNANIPRLATIFDFDNKRNCYTRRTEIAVDLARTNTVRSAFMREIEARKSTVPKFTKSFRKLRKAKNSRCLLQHQTP
jgi:hypothetical protein